MTTEERILVAGAVIAAVGIVVPVAIHVITNREKKKEKEKEYVVREFRALLAKLVHTHYFDLDPEQEIWKFGFDSLKELAQLCASAVVAAKTKRVPRDVRDSVSELHEHVKVLRGFQDSWRLFEIGKNGDWREVQRNWPELGRATASMEAAKPVAARSKRLLSSFLEGA